VTTDMKTRINLCSSPQRSQRALRKRHRRHKKWSVTGDQ